MAKLRALEDELFSCTQCASSDTLTYGDFDPLRETTLYLNPCAACCGRPGLCQAEQRFYVCCECGVIGTRCRAEWQAVLDWNKSRRSVSPDYRTLPCFALDDLEPEAAKARLTVIRRNLELRSKIAGLRRELGESVGRDYQQRLKAYLGWCIYAKSLVKVALEREQCSCH